MAICHHALLISEMGDQILKRVLFEYIKDRKERTDVLPKAAIAGKYRLFSKTINIIAKASVLSLRAFIYEFTRFKI